MAYCLTEKRARRERQKQKNEVSNSDSEQEMVSNLLFLLQLQLRWICFSLSSFHFVRLGYFFSFGNGCKDVHFFQDVDVPRVGAIPIFTQEFMEYNKCMFCLIICLCAYKQG